MATEIIFTKDALDCLTERQLEKLAFLNERFDSAARCRVQRDFSVGDEDNHWIVAIFVYEAKVIAAARAVGVQGMNSGGQPAPFVVGISPEGDSHS